MVAALLLPLGAFAQGYESQDSVIVKPFGMVQKASQVTIGTTTILQEDLEHAAVSDLRNRLTGLIPGLEVIQLDGGINRDSYGEVSLSGASERLFLRGSTVIRCIVDDVVIPIDQLLLEPSQIESITLLSSAADKALFGPSATGGALYITTKKGGYNKPYTVNVDFESGVGVVGLIPEYVNGLEYIDLNNRARVASGYEPLYPESSRGGYALGDAWNVNTPNVDYRSLLIKNFKPVTRFGVNAQGGSEKTKYNISVAGFNDNSIYNVGDKCDYNKLNLTMSVTTKLGKYVEASASANSMISFERDLTNFKFADYKMTPAVAFPLDLGTTTETGQTYTVYAVTRQFVDNPYAGMLEGGTYVNKRRSGMINLSLNTDLSFILPGLKSRTFATLNNFVSYNGGKSNDYYALYWQQGVATEDLERSNHIYRRQSDKSALSKGAYQGWTVYERVSYDKAFGRDALNAGVTYYMSSAERTGNSYFERQQNLIANVSYNHDGKFFADLVLDYSGCTRFERKNRYVLLPTVALAWKPVDKVKIHADAGLLGDYDIYGSHFEYQGVYQKTGSVTFGQDPSNAWFGGTTSYSNDYTDVVRFANPYLTWAKYLDTEVGVDANLCKGLDFGVTAFYRKGMGLITNTTAVYPTLAGWSDTDFFDNYNSNDTYGAEVKLSYKKTFGDFTLGASGWAVFCRTFDTRLANDIYEYDWQKHTGTRSDAIWGYKCLGKFQSASEVASSATIGSETQVGDLKYDDLNGDGKIDANDICVIGHVNPDLNYALNLNLAWKAFDLSVVGTGRAFMDTPLTSSYFMNGWGDYNYSAFVRDNIGGDYPRLAYIQSQDNFALSSFWLRDGGWFKIQNVELGYTLRLAPDSALKSMRICLRGSNLLTLTNIKYVDPENIEAGVSQMPLFKTFTAGLKFNF